VPRLSDPLRVTLGRIAVVMTMAREPWWIITGVAAVLHGIETPVADVDVLLGMDDAREVLGRLGLPLAPGMPSPRYRSELFATWREAPLPVELMAGFAVKGPAGWAVVAPVTRERVEVDGAVLFMPAVGSWWRCWNRWGGPRIWTGCACSGADGDRHGGRSHDGEGRCAWPPFAVSGVACATPVRAAA